MGLSGPQTSLHLPASHQACPHERSRLSDSARGGCPTAERVREHIYQNSVSFSETVTCHQQLDWVLRTGSAI